MTAQRRSRKGFTLIELLMIVVIVGVLTLMAIPRIEPALVRRDLQAGKVALNGLVLRGKTAAVQLRRPVTLSVDSSTAVLSTTSAAGSVQYLALVHLRSEFGVSASSSSPTITIQPTGLVQGGTPFVVRVTKGALSDSLRVTGYGRIE